MALPTAAEKEKNFAGLKTHPSTIICLDRTFIIGDVTIGPDCIIHPTVTIYAKDGPIVIGKENIVEERVVIINTTGNKMTIGNNNVFEVDAICEASSVGDRNLFESKSKVSSNLSLTNNCIIGFGCHLLGDTANYNGLLGPNHIIYGENLKQSVDNLPVLQSYESQLLILKRILPNFQKLYIASPPMAAAAAVTGPR